MATPLPKIAMLPELPEVPLGHVARASDACFKQSIVQDPTPKKWIYFVKIHFNNHDSVHIARCRMARYFELCKPA